MTTPPIKAPTALQEFSARHLPYLRALQTRTLDQHRLVELDGPRLPAEEREFSALLKLEYLKYRQQQIGTRLHAMQSSESTTESSKQRKKRTHDLIQMGLAVKALDLGAWVTPEIFLGYMTAVRQRNPNFVLFLETPHQDAEAWAKLGREALAPVKKEDDKQAAA